jgi:hypothetical protein
VYFAFFNLIEPCCSTKLRFFLKTVFTCSRSEELTHSILICLRKSTFFINMDSTLEDDDSSKGKRKSSELPKKSNKNPQLCSKDKSMDNDSPHCVICLDNIVKKSFANNCLHEFCFECLLKWSKVINDFIYLRHYQDLISYELFLLGKSRMSVVQWTIYCYHP